VDNPRNGIVRSPRDGTYTPPISPSFVCFLFVSIVSRGSDNTPVGV